MLFEERLCRLSFFVDIDSNDDETVIAILAKHFIHPGKRTTAGDAPRRPEVDDDDLPLVKGKVQFLSTAGRDGQ